MVVLQPKQLPDLGGKRVTLLSGRHDPIVPEDHPVALAGMFRAAGADVYLHWLETGHHLSGADFRLAAEALAATSARA
jgi:phospholipase/carboxylesterase